MSKGDIYRRLVDDVLIIGKDFNVFEPPYSTSKTITVATTTTTSCLISAIYVGISTRDENNIDTLGILHLTLEYA